jgi:hypothetical protein
LSDPLTLSLQAVRLICATCRVCTDNNAIKHFWLWVIGYW